MKGSEEKDKALNGSSALQSEKLHVSSSSGKISYNLNHCSQTPGDPRQREGGFIKSEKLQMGVSQYPC